MDFSVSTKYGDNHYRQKPKNTSQRSSRNGHQAPSSYHSAPSKPKPFIPQPRSGFKCAKEIKGNNNCHEKGHTLSSEELLVNETASLAISSDLSSTTSVTSVTEEQSNVMCSICLSNVVKSTWVQDCNHEFCFDCIKLHIASIESSNNGNGIFCPNCRMCFHSLKVIKEDGSFEIEKVTINVSTLPKDHTQTPTTQDDLMCLDHNFFLGEVSRLLLIAENLHNQLLRGKGRLSVWEENSLKSIKKIVSTLYDHRRSLLQLEHFDPHLLLQELYNLNDNVVDIQQSPLAIAAAVKDRFSGSSSSSSDVVRYSASDCWSDDDSNDYDYDEDDYQYTNPKAKAKKGGNVKITYTSPKSKQNKKK